jgi:hypothetical protein
MDVKHKVFHGEEFIKTTATGELDLWGSKLALRALAEDPRYPAGYDLLFDLRDAECELVAGDILSLLEYFITHRHAFSGKIAIVVSDSNGDDLDGARFMEFCAANAGLAVRAFARLDEAAEWVSNGASGESPLDIGGDE